MKLAIIASDAIIRKAVSQYFLSTGVIGATAMPCNANRVLRYFSKFTPDVILLHLDANSLEIISALDKAKGEKNSNAVLAGPRTAIDAFRQKSNVKITAC